MSEETRFVDGMYVKHPHQNAPDFCKAKVSIVREEMIKWLQGEDGEWVNLDIKESKDGKLYASVDTWEPEPKAEHEKVPF